MKQETSPITTNQDEHHLKILSIFHYVVGGIVALFSCIPVFHPAMGIAFLTGGFGPPDNEFPFRLFGLMFTLIPLVIILSGWALAGFIIAVGYFLGQKRRYTFCLVMGGVECIFVPFGTVLGVFTIIVPAKAEVKALFEAGSRVA